jgi:hypothetical protein
MPFETIGAMLVGKLADLALDRIKSKLNVAQFGGALTVNTDAAGDSLRQHFTYVSRWAADVSFRDLWRSKALKDSFVDLDLRLGPARVATGGSGPYDHHVSDLLSLSDHVVLLGDPGAGKTTSLKRVAQTALERFGLGNSQRAPVLVRLRTFEAGDTLTDHLLGTLGIVLKVNDSIEEKQRHAVRLRALTQYLNGMSTLLLIDGLDELHIEARKSVVADIRELLLRLVDARVIITCRTGDYRYNFEQSLVLSVAPLSPDQIKQFADKWLGEGESADFLSKVKRTPYSGTEVRPLTLAHLCAIYERTKDVPEKPRTVYRKVVQLFLEEWDEQQSVRRSSRYAEFSTDRKADFLEALAFQITKQLSRSTFSHSELELAYRTIRSKFELPTGEADKVVREIESHTGLVVAVSRDEFEFAHKAIQEYLTASYILKLPTVPSEVLVRIPNEAAIAVALSSDASAYFASLVSRLLGGDMFHLAGFSEPFLRRLATERVDFEETEQLGMAVLALYAATYYPAIGHQRLLPFTIARESFLEFTRLPRVAGAIRHALRTARVQHEGAQAIILPTRAWRDAMLPDDFTVMVDAELLSNQQAAEKQQPT